MLKSIQVSLLGALLVSATASAEPILDPFKLVSLASDRLSGASSLSFHVEKRFDVVLSDGAKVEYSGALDVLATRAKGLFMDYGDDLSAKRVWYDGQSMTILDTLKNLYVTVPVDGTVAEALTRVARDYGVEMPLAPLLKKNLLEEMKSVVRASYLGIHDAEGEPCHHLLFRGEHVDMQIWITVGDEPLLRKLVVTFWDIEGSPQQSLTFLDWNLEADISANTFKAQLPEGAVAIEILPRGGE
jgi:hypothetical protein